VGHRVEIDEGEWRLDIGKDRLVAGMGLVRDAASL
jgi:hypothetical protein